LRADLLSALADIASPVLLVSNEIGWGVIPMGAEVRHFVDELGRLNQDVAQQCGHITLMAAGQPWTQPVQRWDR
jgi:adenosylcobinamide kinase/adenosylcobinamide-phosphate guanylyltransferase